MERILIVGSAGQLGKSLQKIKKEFPQFIYAFKESHELDITNKEDIETAFEEFKPHFCINAAAYTQVDRAEEDKARAFDVNKTGARYLAEICLEFRTQLIHVSTDYVFDGNTNLPYSEDDWTCPINVYGTSKCEGEEEVLDANPKSIVIRTSWLYSEYGKNFVKTMLSLFSAKKEIGVVADQFGQPTYAEDLARAILKIIASPKKQAGIFHFSNFGETTWFDFAREIAAQVKSPIKIKPLTTEEYLTLAKRPQRSTLDLRKIEKVYGIELEYWQNSLENCLKNLNLIS